MFKLLGKDHIEKVLCQYLYYWLRYRVKKENRPIVIMPTHPKLTQVPRVIHDILDSMYCVDPKDHMLKILWPYL
jgi:hypothetical protein